MKRLATCVSVTLLFAGLAHAQVSQHVQDSINHQAQGFNPTTQLKPMIEKVTYEENSR